VIADYLAQIETALSFDRALSRDVRREVEDHLRESIAADPSEDRLEVEQRAIARFGDAHLIAMQLAAVSLAKQTKRTGATVIVIIAAIFVAMKARVTWYVVMQCTLADDVKAISAIVGSIDRYAFWLSVVVGIGAWCYVGVLGLLAFSDPACRKQLRGFFLLSAAATGALLVTVASDGLLTALRLPGMGLSAEFLVPVLSMTIEIACAGVLVLQIRDFSRRATFAAALPRT
jgi:hypothetical protein